MTEFSEDFLSVLDIEDREDYYLIPEREILDQRTYHDLSVMFVSDLRVQRTVPKVEISWFSSSKVEDAYGDMLTVEDGEATWDKAVPGYQYPTDGIVFKHDVEELKTKLASTDPRQIVAAAYSSGYGLRAVIARTLGVDSLDIQCTVNLSDRSIRLVVYDAEVSGSGLCHTAYQSLDDYLLDTWSSLEGCVCTDFCEKCLLLPRTPTHLVEQGLLNRFDGLQFIME